MEAHIFLQDGEEVKLLAVVPNLEVVPRGFYVVDNEVYQYTGQPTFVIESDRTIAGYPKRLVRVEINVQKYYPPIDL